MFPVYRNSFFLPVLVSALSLSACMGNSKGTIGSLSPVYEQEPELELTDLSHQKVREEYQEILELVEDKELKQQIQRRIADVYMLEGDQSTEFTPSKSYYQEAIKSYRTTLERYPNSPDNAEVLYQLAKAYDLEGDQDQALEMLNRLTAQFPNFSHNAEAFFRKGDIYFNRENYRSAEAAYRSAVARDNPLIKINGHYMLGWTLYKQSAYAESLEAYAFVLDAKLSSVSYQQLSKSDQPLVDDTLHSMSLALVHLGGAEHIARIDKINQRDYVWRLYEQLGEYYLTKERYEDSAQTYRAFVENFSKDLRAPKMHSRLISAYIEGGFPLQALEEKQAFVGAYGIHGHKRFLANDGALRQDLKPQLKTYLQELAQHFHGDAQALEKDVTQLNPEQHSKRIEQAGILAVKQYAQAAQYYQEYIDSFPNATDLADITYLKAETYFASHNYSQAIKDYEQVAYHFDRSKNSSEAGYAAIIAYQRQIELEKTASKAQRQWQAQAVESMLSFSQNFGQDARSPTVLTKAAEYLFGLDQYQRALDVSSTLVAENSNADSNLKKTAYGIMAHSHYKLEDYLSAETQYLNQRALTEVGSDEYKLISERIATSVYKTSEQLVGSEQQRQAVDKLLTIKTLAPSSDVRVTAQLDAANMLLAMELWREASLEFAQLHSLFNTHKDAAQFPRRQAYALEQLAFANQQKVDFTVAAERYEWLYRNDKDPDVQRRALFSSAELYAQAERHDLAIDYFKRYAHRYEQPFDTRMEARYQLAVIYEKDRDMQRHLYWLRRVIDGDKKAGDQRSERSRWLGAWANVKYGDYFTWEFKRTKLRQPLAKSLARKNERLTNASKRYQKAANYQIFEFVTQSSYKIAGLYERMSDDLLGSERPKGLSKADNSRYETLLQQQSAPLLQTAVDLHLGNVERAWDGQYDDWVAKSYLSMRSLNPTRFNKQELETHYGDAIR